MEKERAKFLELLSGYEIPKEHRNQNGEPITGKSFFSRSLSGSLMGKRGLSSNKFINAVKHLTRRFLCTSARVYGAMLLTFGALTAVADLAASYFGESSNTHTALITGLVLTLFGIFFSFSDSPVGNFVENFVLTDYLLFEFFCIKRMQKTNIARGFSPVFGIISGTLCAALGFWLNPLNVILLLCLLLFAAISFASPEFSFLFTVLALPYTGLISDTTSVLSALLIITLLSFLRKVISGKRVYVFEKYDLLIGAMVVFVLISGIFIKGMESFENSVILVLGVVGYILASNLITNRRLADRLSCAVAFSSVPASLYAIAKYTMNVSDGNYTYSGTGFYQASVFGAFIIAAFFLTASLLKESKRAAEQSVYITVLFLQVAALVCTGVFTAAAVILFGGVLCRFILKMRRFSGVFILLLILISYSVFLLPEELLNSKVFTVLLGRSADELLPLWRASLDIFADNPFVGTGMGAEAFSHEISKYGIPYSENSANIFLEIACEAGILALLFFLLVIFTCLRHRAEYRLYVRASQVKTVSNTAMSTFVCLILYGTVNYIWAHPSICFIFWCIFGLCSATLRISKREYDDKIIYYNDAASSESSDIDVQIDGFGR